MSVVFQLRHGTAAEWATANTLLAVGEMGVETDTGQFKLGDGVTPWNARPYGGVQGPPGADSTVPGPQGPQGPPGADSTVPGPQGLQGLTGPQGPQGPAGADSTVPGPQGPQGIQGLQGPQGPTGADSTVPGPQGLQGPPGADGAQGIQGIQGIQGPPGADGAQGIQGPAGSPAPSWYGNLYVAYGDCDPRKALDGAIMRGTVAATPTNIGTGVARIAYFRPPATMVVNRIRFFGVGATTNVYRTALYNGDTLARVTAELPFSTAAATWGAAGSGLNVTLTGGQLYFIAVGVNATGTTAGLLCMGPTVAATTGLLGVLPKNWPGNLDIDLGYVQGALAQFAVTNGALPATAPTIAVQAAWTGGFPLFFLDTNNA